MINIDEYAQIVGGSWSMRGQINTAISYLKEFLRINWRLLIFLFLTGRMGMIIFPIRRYGYLRKMS